MASYLGISRSQLYARAVQKYIERFSSEAITAKLDELYQDDHSGLDPELIIMQTLGDDGW